MGTRTISVSDDAYHRLRRLKREKESFSDAIVRLTGRGDLTRFAGSVSRGFARELRSGSRSFRKRFHDDRSRRHR